MVQEVVEGFWLLLSSVVFMFRYVVVVVVTFIAIVVIIVVVAFNAFSIYLHLLL